MEGQITVEYSKEKRFSYILETDNFKMTGQLAIAFCSSYSEDRWECVRRHIQMPRKNTPQVWIDAVWNRKVYPNHETYDVRISRHWNGEELPE